MTTTIQMRRGTAAQWTAANPTLAAGESGFETDTHKFKIGDGATAWAGLAYAGSGTFTGGTIAGATTFQVTDTAATSLKINLPTGTTAYPFLIISGAPDLQNSEGRWFMAHPEGGLCLSSAYEPNWAILHLYKWGAGQQKPLLRITDELISNGGGANPPNNLFVVDKDGTLHITPKAVNVDVLAVLGDAAANLMTIHSDGAISGRAASRLRGSREIIGGALGLKSMTGDRPANNGSASGTGELRTTAIGLRGGEPYTFVKVAVPGGAGAAGLTLCRAGVFDKNLNLVASSANRFAQVNGVTGEISFPLTATFTPAADDLYYVGVLSVGTTPPSLIELVGGNGLDMTINGLVLSWRQLGLADLPNPAVRIPGNVPYWAGLG